jgi:hypothetical protein
LFARHLLRANAPRRQRLWWTIYLVIANPLEFERDFVNAWSENAAAENIAAETAVAAGNALAARNLPATENAAAPETASATESIPAAENNAAPGNAPLQEMSQQQRMQQQQRIHMSSTSTTKKCPSHACRAMTSTKPA